MSIPGTKLMTDSSTLTSLTETTILLTSSHNRGDQHQKTQRVVGRGNSHEPPWFNMLPTAWSMPLNSLKEFCDEQM
jgi:hypothetical protein